MRLRFAAGLIAACLLAGPAHAASDAPPPGLDPAAVSEAAALLAGQPYAVGQAWQILSAGGLPLIRPHPQDETLARVTFAIRAPAEARAVRFDSVVNAPYAAPVIADYRRDFTLPMQRIAGSPIWAITLDVPRDVQAVYSFLVELPGGTVRHADSANPRRLGGQASESVLTLDRSADRSVLRPRREPPAGESLTIDSEALGRPVSVRLYRAAGTASETAPVIVLYDAFLWDVRAPAWQIAANLAGQGRIEPVNLVLVDRLDEASASHAYDDQGAFLIGELLPHLRSEAGLAARPRDVILAGASRRGLAATRAALNHPAEIGGVIALSGSFYWSPPDEAPQWLARQVTPADPAAAPRFYLAAGSLEYVHTATNRGHVMLQTNRAMQAALSEAGYPAELHVYPGGHDIAAWRLAFADGLVAMLGR